MTARVFAIVLAYNSEQWIKTCVEQLLASIHPVTVIVVDNASQDTTPQILQNYPELTVLTQSQNLGFGGGNNLGMRYALQQGADYILLLNDDVEILPETVGTLVEVAQAQTEYGIISPMHLNGSGTAFDRGFRQYLRENKQKGTSRFLQDCYLEQGTTRAYNIHFVNAAAWLLTRQCVQQVGGFDPIFHPAYGEDLDLTNRILYHGFQIGFVPAARIYHHRERAQQHNFKRPWRQLARIRSMTEIAKLKDPRKNLWRSILAWLSGRFSKSLSLLLRGEWRELAILWLSSRYTVQKLLPLWRSYRLTRQPGAHWIGSPPHSPRT